MPNIVGPRALRAVQKLPFCYVCGKAFAPGDSKNRDHVPPSSCMARDDRVQGPLILPSHVACNDTFKLEDESVGQYISVLHGRLVEPDKRRLRRERFSSPALARPEHQIEAVTNVDLYGAVQRWVRAFHAALYQRPMPEAVKFAIELPLDVVSPTDDSFIIDTGRPRQRQLCEETITRNRAARSLDRLAGWNGKLQYECVWSLTPMHAYCVFWLDVYDWRRLARLSGKPPKDCVGIYCLFRGELPPHATTETQILTEPKDRLRFGM